MFAKLDILHKEESEFLGQREEDYLIAISNDLQETIKAIDETHQIDIVSDRLRVALARINDLMGNQVTKTMEDIYQTLFSKFCLGK
jgi:tRNA U34 5-carboxymethylaminomethyl modifying GTPase MnmE/TrmE